MLLFRILSWPLRNRRCAQVDPKEATATIPSNALRSKLRAHGLTDEVVNLAWPSWWTDEAEASASAQAELRFTVARRLGLDARSLLEHDEPSFLWKVASFKNLGTVTEAEIYANVSFGTSLARVLTAAVPSVPLPDLSAGRLRAELKRSGPIVLPSILSLCWAIGIPVVQLAVFPLPARRMVAMTVKVGDRFAILLAKESRFPAQIAYYLAHELGHIAKGHLASTPAMVEVEDPLENRTRDEPEELAADAYALELLTGESEPRVLTEARRYSAAGLARAAVESAAELGIDAGTLLLCFGHSTGRWDKATAALKKIYSRDDAVGLTINRAALSQLVDLSDENEQFVRGAMGIRT